MQNVAPPPFTWPDLLYLRLSEDGLCLARYEKGIRSGFPYSARRLSPQSAAEELLREACQTDPVAQGPTRNVEVVVSGSVTPVPLTYFQEEYCETYFDYCFPNEGKKRRVFYDTVAAANVVLLFSLEDRLCRAVEEHFENVHYTATLTAVVRHFAMKDERTRASRSLYAYCHESACDVAVFAEGQLQLLNTYRVNEATDAAYYILNVAKELKLDLLRTPLQIAGTAELRAAIGEELQKYAQNVLHLNPIAEFQRHPVAQKAGIPYDLMTLLID